MSDRTNEKKFNLIEVNEIKKLFDQKLYFDTWLKIKQLITNLTSKEEDLLNCLVDIILPINIDLFNQDALGFNIHPLEFTILAIKISDFKKIKSTCSASRFLQKNLEFLKTLKNNSIKSKEDLNNQFLEAILILKTKQTMLKFTVRFKKINPILEKFKTD